MVIKSQFLQNGKFAFYVKQWYQLFCKDEFISIGIARKTPRLWELCKNVFEEKTSHKISTEHALPFIIPYLDDKKKIILSDDAIYFGTTFERIHAVILTGLCLFGEGKHKREDVVSMPVVMSNDAMRIRSYIKMPEEMTPNTESEREENINRMIISSSDIPNYIDHLVGDFRKLGKPYDVEFPLFYLQMPAGYSTETLATHWEEQIRTHLETIEPEQQTYRLITQYDTCHPIEGQESSIHNYTLLLEDVTPKKEYRISSDFRKLRIFTSEDGMCRISSFVPHFIPDEMIVRDNPLFVGTVLEDCWTQVYDAAQIPDIVPFREEYLDFIFRNNAETENEWKILWDNQLTEYIYHCKRSLVIWCNYLLSFYKFLETKRQLHNVLEHDGFNTTLEMQRYDLELLIGPQLAQEIGEKLEKILAETDEPAQLPIIGMIPVSQFEVIPPDLEDIFLHHCREDFKRCTSLSELVSVEFSNQHRWLELKSRASLNVYFNRLRFGTSYTSLNDKFMFSRIATSNTDEMTKQLHQSIDYRIDTGSVVPKYVLQSKDSCRPWLRLFKAGENEDKQKDQLHRIMLGILQQIAGLFETQSLPQWIVELCFNLTFGNLAKEEKFIHLGGLMYRVVYNEEIKYFQTQKYDETGSWQSLTDSCERFQLVSPTDDGFYALQENDYTRYLMGSSILDLDTQSMVSAYVEVAHTLIQKTDMESTTNLLCWLHEWNIATFSEQLSTWERDFVDFVQNSYPGDEYNVLPYIDSLYCLFDVFPYDETPWLEVNSEEGEAYESDKESYTEPFRYIAEKIKAVVESKRAGIANDDNYIRLNEKLETDELVANLLADRIDITNFGMVKEEIDDIKKRVSKNEITDWLNRISVSEEAFLGEDIDKFKKYALLIL